MRRLDDGFGESQLAIDRLRMSQTINFGIVIHMIFHLFEIVFEQVAAATALASPPASS